MPCQADPLLLVFVVVELSGGRRPEPEPALTWSVVVLGSRSVLLSSGDHHGFPLFVSPGGASVVNVAVVNIVACTPAGFVPKERPDNHPERGHRTQWVLAATASKRAMFENAKAKFTDFVAGRFRPATASGPPTATGNLRDTVVSPADRTPRPVRRMFSRWRRPMMQRARRRLSGAG